MLVPIKRIVQILLLQLWACAVDASWFSTLTASPPGVTWNNHRWLRSPSSRPLSRSPLSVRGGSTTGDATTASDDDDEERYSRQVYTLGARAHGLIRSATVYLDGPPSSGLVYEVAKNLALSGIRHLVLVASDESADNSYHNAALDDLGRTYQRGAKSEIFGEQQHQHDNSMSNDGELLVEYLRRLNPNIIVSSVERSSLLAMDDDSADDGQQVQNAVFLCMDRPYSTQVSANQLARRRRWPFVSVETAGVFGRAFCDFGPSFTVFDPDGETPNVTPLDRIELADNDDDDDDDDSNKLEIHCVEGEKHDVSKGDIIKFQFRNGAISEEQCAVTYVKNPYHFSVELAEPESSDKALIGEFASRINNEATSFSRIKTPQAVAFKTLDAAVTSAKMDGSLFTACDLEKSFDDTRRSATMSCFQALSRFVENEQRFPTLVDLDSFWQLAQKTFSADGCGDSGEDHCSAFLRGCAAKFTPLQAMFGAIGAQEALKAATGLYFPVRQILLYDCDEVLTSAPQEPIGCPSETVEQRDKDSSLGLRHILGDKIVNRLQRRKLFVVGAGAIGCEILKNLASMGVGSRKKGRVILTDMDTIEKSNLSRQLLFRDGDIGKFKSVAAQEASRRMNPAMKVETHSSKVGGDSHSPFDEFFWSKEVDIILNALDNVEARLYMDGQCVANKKALIDAGTMGPKGNVQVVVPNQSESYSSSVDPPEPAIPVCTLKNFPYAISHTIQWGRDLFDGLFQRRPEQANDFMDLLQSDHIRDLAQKFVQDKGDDSAVEIAEALAQDLTSESTAEDIDIQRTREDALLWAASLAYKLFHQASSDLLLKHPINSVDEDGEPFWTGTRRPPHVLSFMALPLDANQESINLNLIEFVRNGARLRTETILGKDCGNGVSHFTAEEAEHAYMADAQEDSDVCQSSSDTGAASPNDRVQHYLGRVVTGTRRFAPAEFEKDDDSNGHVAFVSAASNLRAIAYGIPPVDAMETRRVAGNIVPAMITTTAFVSALSCIELIKLVQKADLRVHRNAFINLALPFFAFTMPLPAEKAFGLNGREYTLWDQLSIRESKRAANSGGITVNSLLKRIKKRASDEPSQVDVASISCGPYMLYANFLHEDDEEILTSSIWDLVSDAVTSSDAFDNENSRDNKVATSDDFTVHQNFVDLTVVVEDMETGNEVELPLLRVERFQE